MNPGIANYGSPHEIPAHRFKLIGGAPFLFGIIGVALSAIFIVSGSSLDSTPVVVVIGLASGLLGSLNESDEFAVKYPAALQKYAADHRQWDSDVAQNYIESC